MIYNIYYISIEYQSPRNGHFHFFLQIFAIARGRENLKKTLKSTISLGPGPYTY